VKPTFRVDRSVFDRKMLEMRKARPRALREGVSVIGAEIATQASRISKRDTNRFARSIEMAQNDLARIAGTTAIGVSPARVSSRELEYLERLRRQAEKAAGVREKWRGFILRNVRKENFDPSWPSHQKLTRTYDKIAKRSERAADTYKVAKEAVENNESFAIIGGRKPKDPIKQLTLLSTLTRVDLKVHGGIGRIESYGDKAFAVITIREPHGKIVERRDGPLRAATAAARGSGIRRASFRYLKTLQASTTAVRG
jgi:hypothetical protein